LVLPHIAAKIKNINDIKFRADFLAHPSKVFSVTKLLLLTKQTIAAFADPVAGERMALT